MRPGLPARPRSAALSAALVLSALVLGASSDAGAQGGITTRVPERLVRVLLGCWRIGPEYTIDFVRAGRGLAARQVNEAAFYSDYTATVRYDTANDVIGFDAVSMHHAAVIRMQWTGTALRFVFSAMFTAGRFHDAMPQVATRCSAAPATSQ